MVGRIHTPASRGRQRATWGLLALTLAGAVSCGHQNTETGRSPSYLYIESLTAASGAQPDAFGGTLSSDVLTLVKKQEGGQEIRQPTIFADLGRVFLRMGLKDAGSPNAPTSPTYVNSITVDRYRVVFKRSDGRNTQGVDVPYAFDGGATGTFDSNGGSLGFTLVRAQAKLEPPLMALRNMGGDLHISTIAEVTFYGQDQNGNKVEVTGMITVAFADWGDPD